MSKLEKIKMFVEIPKGSTNKYEYDYSKGVWNLDRVLHGSMFYPEEYGFIPETLDYDGDPLDVVCLTNFKTFPGCNIDIRIIGVMKMVDQGDDDYKIIAVNSSDPRLNNIKKISDVSEEKLREISHFFMRYKELEKKEVEVNGFGDEKEAQKVLEECINLFKKFSHIENKDELINAMKKSKIN